MTTFQLFLEHADNLKVWFMICLIWKVMCGTGLCLVEHPLDKHALVGHVADTEVRLHSTVDSFSPAQTVVEFLEVL